MAKVIENEEIIVDENLEANKNVDISSMCLYERILRIMNEIKITKTGRNTFSQYDYFKPEELNLKITPWLEKYKVFPHFYTCQETFDVEVCEFLDDARGIKYVTKKEIRDIAKLELIDVFGKDKPVIYQIPIEKVDIKGANKMQNVGGVRTYAKRYLYMEAFNISDNRLDLDSDEMANKSKTKPASKDSKVADIVGEIQIKVEALRNAKVKDADIAKTIKSVYSDGGKPSANYRNCQNVEDAKRILDALNNEF